MLTLKYRPMNRWYIRMNFEVTQYENKPFCLLFSRGQVCRDWILPDVAIATKQVHPAHSRPFHPLSKRG